MISSRQRKYALVTGASSGIGREYAAQLAAKGYDLVMAGNRNEENRAAAREIAARYGVRTLPLCMDLSEPDAAVKLHAETSARGIEIGVLVCNAGVLLFGPLAAAPPERIGRIVTLHCTTPALLCRLYGEEMRRRGEGYILVMSSATAWMPYPTIAAYAATKSFLRTFARSLNFEFRKYGVRVTGVFPGRSIRRCTIWTPPAAAGCFAGASCLRRRGWRNMASGPCSGAVAAAFRVFSRKSASVSAGWFRRG